MREPSESQNKDSPSTKCQLPSRRANEPAEVREISCLRMGNYSWRGMSHMSNAMKMSKVNGNNTTLLLSQNGLRNDDSFWGKMFRRQTSTAFGCPGRTGSRRTISKKINLKIDTWNVRTSRQAGRLENLTLKIDKCELSEVGLNEMWWHGKGEILFYSGGINAEKLLQ